jgi:hypothetical protein
MFRCRWNLFADLRTEFQKDWLGIQQLVEGECTCKYTEQGHLKDCFHFLNIKGADRLCGLAVRVPSYRSTDPGSIPGATKFSEKWVWNGGHSAS